MKIKLPDWMDNWMVKEAIFILAIIFSAVVVMVFALNRLEWIAESASIERLRIDASNVDSKMAEDVAGQVAEKNKRIAVNRSYRKTILKFLVPSGWDTIEFINMPNPNWRTP